MAYNRKNYLKKVLEVQEIYLKQQKIGLSNMKIWQIYIEPLFFITLRTMYKYLEVNAKKEIKEFEL